MKDKIILPLGTFRELLDRLENAKKLEASWWTKYQDMQAELVEVKRKLELANRALLEAHGIRYPERDIDPNAPSSDINPQFYPPVVYPLGVTPDRTLFDDTKGE